MREQGTFDFICEACGDKGSFKKGEQKYANCITRPFIEQLVQRRKELGMTQEELNHVIGLGDRYLSKWEVFIKSPTLFNATCWANALNCDIVLKPKS